jgi:hypothetical protein
MVPFRIRHQTLVSIRVFPPLLGGSSVCEELSFIFGRVFLILVLSNIGWLVRLDFL